MNKLVRCENYYLCNNDSCEHYGLHEHTRHCRGWCKCNDIEMIDCIQIPMEDFIEEKEMVIR
jgi:hypothetical protein